MSSKADEAASFFATSSPVIRALEISPRADLWREIKETQSCLQIPREQHAFHQDDSHTYACLEKVAYITDRCQELDNLSLILE